MSDIVLGGLVVLVLAFEFTAILDKNPWLFHSMPGDTAGVCAAPAQEQEAWKVCSF
jgi:hypothetical protein